MTSMLEAHWQHDRGEHFLQAVPAGYIEVRADGMITAANRFFVHSLGYEGAALIGGQVRNLLYSFADRTLFEEQWRVIAGGGSTSFAVTLRGRVEEQVLASLFVVPTFGDFEGGAALVSARLLVVPCAEMERHLALIERTASGPRPLMGLDAQRVLTALTRREGEVVHLLRSGLRVGGIAQRLGLSPYTVRNHLKRIFRKIGVRSQSELLLLLAEPPEGAATAPRGAGS